MKWKRIKCFLTGGHRLYDKNLQTIHDTNGYHFINYCVKCGKVFAAFMAEAELNGLIDLGNSVPHPDRFNCPYVNRIGQLTVSVLLNRFARKEHRV